MSMLTRARYRPRGRARGNRSGFSLIEIIVSLTLLAVAMTALGKLAVILDQDNSTVDLRARRNFALMREENKFLAMRYDTLTSASFSTAQKTLYAGGLGYYRRITLTSDGNNRYTVKIVIVPLSDTTKKDSVTFDRSKTVSDVLCTGC